MKIKPVTTLKITTVKIKLIAKALLSLHNCLRTKREKMNHYLTILLVIVILLRIDTPYPVR